MRELKEETGIVSARIVHVVGLRPSSLECSFERIVHVRSQRPASPERIKKS